MKTYLEIPFKEAAGHALYADFYIPDNIDRPPVILWIHGGGWKDLNRKWCLVYPQLERGYAVCSVDYRYSDEAPFPAQMLDLKDALLFVKANGDTYGYDGSKVVVSGDSAGGHLCSLLAVSAGNSDWEKAGEDYRVQAVVEFCGPCRLGDPGHQDTADHDIVRQLLGVSDCGKALAGRGAAASPDTYVDGTEPPFLILHGSADPAVSPDQSRILRNALESAGIPVHMYLIPGGVHGLGGELVDCVVQEFLDYYIKNRVTVLTPELQPIHDRTVPPAVR